jgi:hypothetical protein
MGKHDKLLRRILGGRSDAGIALTDLRALLLHLGFEERIRGSHHIFRRAARRDASWREARLTCAAHRGIKAR